MNKREQKPELPLEKGDHGYIETKSIEDWNMLPTQIQWIYIFLFNLKGMLGGQENISPKLKIWPSNRGNLLDNLNKRFSEIKNYDIQGDGIEIEHKNGEKTRYHIAKFYVNRDIYQHIKSLDYKIDGLDFSVILKKDKKLSVVQQGVENESGLELEDFTIFPQDYYYIEDKRLFSKNLEDDYFGRYGFILGLKNNCILGITYDSSNSKMKVCSTTPYQYGKILSIDMSDTNNFFYAIVENNGKKQLHIVNTKTLKPVEVIDGIQKYLGGGYLHADPVDIYYSQFLDSNGNTIDFSSNLSKLPSDFETVKSLEFGGTKTQVYRILSGGTKPALQLPSTEKKEIQNYTTNFHSGLTERETREKILELKFDGGGKTIKQLLEEAKDIDQLLQLKDFLEDLTDSNIGEEKFGKIKLPLISQITKKLSNIRKNKLEADIRKTIIDIRNNNKNLGDDTFQEILGLYTDATQLGFLDDVVIGSRLEELANILETLYSNQWKEIQYYSGYKIKKSNSDLQI